jgi:hypothetical protein
MLQKLNKVQYFSFKAYYVLYYVEGLAMSCVPLSLTPPPLTELSLYTYAMVELVENLHQDERE